MNKFIENLHPYPFEKLNALLRDIVPQTDAPLIAWSVGEPKHETAAFLIDAFKDDETVKRGLATYPPTRGLPGLRDAIATFITNRYKLRQPLDPDREVLPVNGTREALFAIAQTVLSIDEPGRVLMPNPFYQIYEGASILAGHTPYYVNCTARSDFNPDFDNVPADIWEQCKLVYICTPGNPTGKVMDKRQITALINLADEHDFIIVSDECYSEIYPDENNPPTGLLEVAATMGRNDYRRCITFNSLSKRSNLPGLRSGYVAGDAEIIEKFLLYRTYHGSAMPVHHQLVSTLAWQDEQHVIDNRVLYREKFNTLRSILEPVWPLEMPDAGFYFWAETPVDDQVFATRLMAQTHIKVLPGSYLSRDTDDGNPGENRVRMALVATLEECVDAAERITDNWQSLSAP